MPNAPRQRWSGDGLLGVLNPYHKLRFDQFDSRQPVIIDLAKRMGRTSCSLTPNSGHSVPTASRLAWKFTPISFADRVAA